MGSGGGGRFRMEREADADRGLAGGNDVVKSVCGGKSYKGPRGGCRLRREPAGAVNGMERKADQMRRESNEFLQDCHRLSSPSRRNQELLYLYSHSCDR
jgi:hypothetical protein